MRLSDLVELKSILEIALNNTSEDSKLLFFLEYASDWIAEFLNRPGLFYKNRTEYYNGTNTPFILLRSRPVNPSGIEVYLQSQGGFYGQASSSFPASSLLTYGGSYFLQIDQDDGMSRCGILQRINDVWPRPYGRGYGYLTPHAVQDTGSIKVVYNGGYTIDGLPSTLRLACNTLAAKMRGFMPMAMELSSENYEERAISIVNHEKDYLMKTVKDMIFSYRNWNF